MPALFITLPRVRSRKRDAFARPRVSRTLLLLLVVSSITACGDRSQGGLMEPEPHGSPSAQAISVDTAGATTGFTSADSISTSVTVKNTAKKRVSVDVVQMVTGPNGSGVRSRTWYNQQIPANKAIVLEDRFVLNDPVPGTYTVGIVVTVSGSSTLLYELPGAATFQIASATLRYVYQRLANPYRTVVTGSSGEWIATLTDGASTVTLAGPSRTFAEPAHTSHTVTHATWVRVLPAPFSGTVDETWLRTAAADTSADILQLGMQYIHGAPSIVGPNQLRIAGDADYGPLQADGTRQEGSDFNDYLGIAWNYGSVLDHPEPEQLNSLDCSGFVRMIFGYRGGLPLSMGPDGVSIPRRAYMIYDSAPGVVTRSDTGAQVTDFSGLLPGDLVFFDASTDDGPRIDHVGVFLGVDSGGYHRFISSRKGVNGPTLGDYKGRSILDTVGGTGLYARSFRAVRRL